MQSLTAQAKAKLKEIQKETDDANKILSQRQGTISELISEEEARRSNIVNLAAEKKTLDESIMAKKAELSGIEVAYTECNSKRIEASDGEISLRKEKEKHEGRQRELIYENASLESDKKDRKREIDGMTEVRSGLETEVKNLNGEKVKLEQDISMARASLAKIQGLLNKVRGAIDHALEQFRIFEGRIGRLSQETGYLISWDNPADLLEEEENHVTN